MNNTTQDCGRHFLTECDCQPQTSEGSWEDEFDRKYVCTTTPHMPCEHVFPDGDSYGVKAFISKTLARERRDVVEEFKRTDFSYIEGRKLLKKLKDKELNDLTREEQKSLRRDAEATILRLGFVASELARRQNDQEASGIIQEIISKWDQLKAHLTTGGGENK